ncbi:kinesin-like protein KIN-14P [Punica granatum]|uniref:Kinesin-like protein KIN-14P n=1 Tax=Punica granatum TaxID=22663 RepID=A0A218VXU9_PUNGR|nr:kinesin-like protein KIN-14P [Punica granatum]OWM65143.1 hypothetical protein CDL15_Pgr008730 [Punica granatum]
MDSLEAKTMKENGTPNKSNLNSSNGGDLQARQKAALIEWLNSIQPDLGLQLQASDEQLRACLLDGSVLCHILKRLRPNEADPSSMPRSERISKFLTVLGEMGIPRFELSDLEKGSLKSVIESLLLVRTHLLPNSVGERRKILSESKVQRSLGSPVMSEPSAALVHHAGLKFHEVFQLKQGQYADLPPAKITEMMKSNSLDNAPTQSLLSVVNGILEESIERKNAEIPLRVACLLRKVVQEIERRISTQADHLRTQNNLFKAREEKYQSRIKVLEALANGTPDETEITRGRLQQMKPEKEKTEEKRKFEEEDVERLMKEKDSRNQEISALKQELELVKKTADLRCLQIEAEAKGAKTALEETVRELERQLAASRSKVKELETCSESKNEGSKELERQAATLRSKARELDACLESKNEEAKELLRQLSASRSKVKELEDRSESKNQGAKELERQLAASRSKVKELEMYLESKDQRWNKKELTFRSFMEFQFSALQELRLSSNTIKQEVLDTQGIYLEEFSRLGVNFQALSDAAANYHTVLMENRKMFNELQDLKGNIRVYCRVRPFLPGQSGRQTIVECVGDDGELVVANPSKSGKEGHRMFKFNKVFGPTATQANVYSDIQPFVRSVLDGYNVCIFAYGQTGSGKTYTMTGPNMASKDTWGVNYRALNDLFQISQTRSNVIKYEVMVQMVEIYNEQVRDLLSSDGSQKKLGILTATQSSGLAVPDASMHSVRATSDVLDLMDSGFKNRAVGATALNERSSRSHSILTIHVRGTDQKTGTALRGSLHLVDLAGSERVDRSEVTGDRLREAQHINKSLSALGDVIFALAQKSSHVPYRNSKLTQVLQSSLGGQAKTLMFVQLNPDTTSYSESLSTLKFAERVSGVELGAAKSSKEGRDVRELMEQVVSLRDTITKREEEIERLQLLKDHKNVNHENSGMDLSSESNFAEDTEDYEERTSNASDSLEAEIDGTAEDSADNLERPQLVSKATRPSARPGQTASTTGSPKVSSGKKPAAAGSSTLLKPPRRWQ